MISASQFAVLIRVLLLLYGEWQDNAMQVKFTDIDYFVISDGASYVAQGESPFQRMTYRYTPLLAWILLPNVYLSPFFGKVIFMSCDLIIGYMLKKILLLRDVSEKDANGYVNYWLLNPFVITISTRGNAESLVCLLVIGTLYCFVNHRFVLGSIIFGLSVHFKIFPILYALPLLFLWDENFDPSLSQRKKKFSQNQIVQWISNFVNSWRIKFTLISACTFFALTFLMYSIYGMEFINEAYLYHVTRKDHRHNFSIYFYYIYLNFDETQAFLVGLLSFLPQLLVQIATVSIFGKDIFFTFFLQTFAFVVFNKVCTSQYFLWYICFLPLILPLSAKVSTLKQIIIFLAWFIPQLTWLHFAYRLEFLGQNTFFELWIAGILFFASNCWVIGQFLQNIAFQPTFQNGILSKIKERTKIKK